MVCTTAVSDESEEQSVEGAEGATTEDERVACPDDVCTGALDHEGRCGTCERVFAQYARAAVSERTDEARTDEARTDEERADEDDPQRESGAGMRDFVPSEPDGDDERQCCDDDLCTGALGPDGVCGTCGRSSIKLAPSGSEA